MVSKSAGRTLPAPDFFGEESEPRPHHFQRYPFHPVRLGRSAGCFSPRRLSYRRKSPGSRPGLPNLRSRRRWVLYAHFVAENRHFSGDGEDEVNVPKGPLA